MDFGWVKCVDNLPHDSCIVEVRIDGVSTLLTRFLEFDGAYWLWGNFDQQLRAIGKKRSDVYWMP